MLAIWTRQKSHAESKTLQSIEEPKSRAIAVTTTTTTTATRAYDGERDRRKDRAEGQVGARSSQARASGVPRRASNPEKRFALFLFSFSTNSVDGREDAALGVSCARDRKASTITVGPRPHSLSPFSRATTKTRTLTEKSSFLFLSLFPLVETQASTPERTTRRAISR